MDSAREARRRRIVERGTDRLAFITGQVRSLPQSTSAPSDQQDPPQPTVASVPGDDVTCSDSPKHQASDEMVCSTVESDTGKELFPNCNMSKELPRRGNSDEIPKHEIVTDFCNYETNNGIATEAQQGGQSSELLTVQTSHRSPDQVAGTAPSNAIQRSHRNFTPSQITRSISVSENIRLFCSIMIGLMVVLSHHGYLLGGKLGGSIVNLRPLFLVLLTDATIVFGHLLLIQGRDHIDAEMTRKTVQEDFGWANDIGKALEAAMLVQKALAAVFMDCSICAVIMISGFAV